MSIPRVFNFSGGPTSAMMTIMGKPTKNDIVLFTDTGREHIGTYDFIDDFQVKEGIKVHIASYPGGFSRLVDKRNYIPNQAKRFCTGELKILTAKRYLRSIGVQRFYSLIGFRFDEQKRVLDYKNEYKKVTPLFPLYDAGVVEADVDAFWLSKDYRLFIPKIYKNCDCCFQKGKGALIAIMQNHPEWAQKWIDDENRIGHTYIKGVSYQQLLDISKVAPRVDIDKVTPAFSCSCTS